MRLRRLAHAALALSAAEEEGLLDESEVAQRLAQRLLVELASVG